MKTANIALFALTAGSASAQFFVLYGRDTVVSRIDPIVSPGGIGMHAHEFMGAGNVDQNTDYDSLQKSTCSSMGRANGNPIIEDKSVYWHPTLYVKANNGTYLRVPVRHATFCTQDFMADRHARPTDTRSTISTPAMARCVSPSSSPGASA